MRVVFLEEVTNVAKAGDLKEVKNGFARNFLFPKNLAVLATPGQVRRVEALKKTASLKQETAGARAEALAPKLEGQTIVITAKSGPSGRLYGSVTPTVVAAELSRAVGQEIGAGELALQEPIKTVGTYQTLVRLAPEVEPTVTIEVVEVEEVKPTIKRKRKPKAKAPTPVVEAPEKAEEAEVAVATTVEEVVGEAAPGTAVKTEEEVVAVSTEAEQVLGEVAEEPDAAEPAIPAPALDKTIAVAEEPVASEPEAPAPALDEAIAVAEEPEAAEPETPAPALDETVNTAPPVEAPEVEAPADKVVQPEEEPSITEESEAASTRAKATAAPEPEKIDEKRVQAAVRRAKRRSSRASAKVSEEPTKDPEPGDDKKADE